MLAGIHNWLNSLQLCHMVMSCLVTLYLFHYSSATHQATENLFGVNMLRYLGSYVPGLSRYITCYYVSGLYARKFKNIM